MKLGNSRVSLLVAACALSCAPTAPGADNPHLKKIRGRYAQALSDLQSENASMKQELGELRRMLETLLANQGAAAAPPAAAPPAPPTQAPLSAEERELMKEFASELGEDISASTADPTPDPQSLWPGASKATILAPTGGTPLFGGAKKQRPEAWARRNFWGVGGVAGQTNVLDIGLASEAIYSTATERGTNELTDSFNLRETELSIGGWVDPFHRADMLLVWNDLEGETAVEEGYLTFFNLPEGFRARAGKFRSRTGKVNGLHLADLPWVTMPKVNETFLGEEGFGNPGARLTYVGEPRGKWSWSLDLEVFQGDSETLVDPQGLTAGGYDGSARQDSAKRNRILSAHLQNHFQLDDVTDLEVGYSRLEADDGRVDLDGIDITWRKLNQPGRNEWKLQFEGMKQRRNDLAGSGNDDRAGYYAWASRRFNRNWEAGVRVDRVEPIAAGAQGLSSWAHYWTYYPTEFTWYRLQYQEDELANGMTDKQVYLQFRWQLGVDRHALQ